MKHINNIIVHSLKACVFILLTTALAVMFTLTSTTTSFADDHIELKWKLCMYGSEGRSRNQSFYAFESSRGDLILVDGGYPNNVELIRKVIKKNGGHVSAWILTHPHEDHVGGFIEFYKKGYDKQYPVSTIYARTFSNSFYDQNDTYVSGIYNQYKCILKKNNYRTFNEKTHLVIDNLTLRFLSLNPKTLRKKVKHRKLSFNTYSAVIKATVNNKKSVLLTGDITSEVSDLMIRKYGNSLQSYYMQLPHHGKETGLTKLLSKVKPKIVLIDHTDDNSNKQLSLNIRYLKTHGIKYYTIPYKKKTFQLNQQ